jgi:hypothetical protein
MIYPWEIEVDVAEEVVLQSPTLRRLMLGKAQELVAKSDPQAREPPERSSGGGDTDPEST